VKDTWLSSLWQLRQCILLLLLMQLLLLLFLVSQFGRSGRLLPFVVISRTRLAVWLAVNIDASRQRLRTSTAFKTTLGMSTMEE
jgi:hypothetical protein